MEILVISHKYPPSIGGMQTHCFKLVQELQKEHKVHELIWKSNYPKVFFLLTAVLRALWKLRKHKSIEVIYVNDGLMALFCTPLLFLTKTPITVTIHGLDINFPLKAYLWWARKYLNRFSAIITVSGPTTQLAISKGLEPHHIHQVDNAVDINITSTPENLLFKADLGKELGVDLSGKFILTSLGRAIPRKGFNWFAREVMTRLPENCVYLVMARKFPEARLFKQIEKFTSKGLFEKIRLLVGAEIDDEALNNSIRELGLENRVVHVHQFTHSRQKIFEVIRHADIFVMPNLKITGDYEGFGLVALEAASQGTLTLAADVDGIPSAVKSEVNGYLIESGNADKWAESVKYWMDHPEKLSQKSREFKSNTLSLGRSWQQMTKEYVKVFEKVANAD